MESTCDMGDAARRLVYISEEIRGGIRDVEDKLIRSISTVAGDDDAIGYSIPNSEKYQSGMSLEEIAPAEMTGFRSTAAETNLEIDL